MAILRTRPSSPQTRAVCESRELLLVWPAPVYWPGCTVCAIGAPRASESESFMQQMYQPFLTICDGTEPAAPTAPSTGLPTATAPGRPPPGFAPPAAQAGRGPAGSPGPVEQQYASHHARGSSVQPGHCHHPAGWQGDTCQTDVDECRAGGGNLSPALRQHHGFQGREGHSPSADAVLCLPK